MNFDHIYSAIAALADIEAVAGELAEHHADDRTACVFSWMARESKKARTCLAHCAEGGGNDEAT